MLIFACHRPEFDDLEVKIKGGRVIRMAPNSLIQSAFRVKTQFEFSSRSRELLNFEFCKPDSTKKRWWEQDNRILNIDFDLL